MDLSGLFVAISSIGVAWVAAYYGFLTAKETAKKDSLLADENYQRELLKERNLLLVEPLRAEIARLEAFRDALMFYHLAQATDAFTQERKEEAERAMLEVATVIYKYPAILQKWEHYYPYYTNLDSLSELRNQTEVVLRGKRTDLSGWLRRFYAPEPEELEQEQHMPRKELEHGPFVRFALIVETWLKRFR